MVRDLELDVPISFSGHGCTPLHLACERAGNAAMVRYLCECGADKNATTSISGFSPLHIASSMGNADAVAALAEQGANLEQVAAHGLTPLIAAAQHGNAECVATLISVGANVDQTAENGIAPLHLAASEGHTETVRNLITGGADTNVATTNGFTPLEFCALHDRLATAQVLCAHGAAHGDALELAREHGHTSLYEWLRQTAGWSTPLHYLEVVTPTHALSLLRGGADVHTGCPSPATLARAAEARGEAPPESTAWLVLRAASLWSPENHDLFPADARQRARELLGLGYSLARSRYAMCPWAEGSLVDAWREFVMPHAVTRE